MIEGDRGFTGEMLRAARALARLDRAELAHRAGVSFETVKRLERMRGPVSATPRTIAAVQAALETCGVAFHRHGHAMLCVCHAGDGRSLSELLVPSVAEEPPSLSRLVYVSCVAPDAAADVRRTIEAIVEVSLRRNERLGLTGALLHLDGWFLQALEGDRHAIIEVYGDIAFDPRHARATLLQCCTVGTRLFSNWILCAGEAPRSNAPGTSPNADLDRMSALEALELLEALQEVENSSF